MHNSWLKTTVNLGLGLYGFILSLYAVVSYGLTAPNLVLLNNEWFWRFQTWMWAHFFNQRTTLVIVYLTLFTVLFMVYAGFLILKNRYENQLAKLLSPWTYILIILPLLFAYNALSFDVFNYIFNAKMVVHYQANPHVQVALDFPEDPWIRFMHNVHTPAPYGYGWTVLSLLPFMAGFKSFLLTWIMFKAFSLLSLFLLFVSLQYFAKEYLNRYLTFSELLPIFLNPLLLIEVVGNAHNDLWMMLPAIFALGLIVRKTVSWPRVLTSMVLLIFSISIKFATLVLVPIWLAILLYNSSWVKTKLAAQILQVIVNHIPILASLLLFLPLLTVRSQQFHPWYLLWPLVWLPFIKTRLWRFLLIAFSISSLLRYYPWLLTGEYTNQSLLQQKLITWSIPLVVLGVFLLVQLLITVKPKLFNWIRKGQS